MRVLICEDSVLLREGLIRLLSDAGHDVVAALPDATSLVATATRLEPDIAVIDVRLPPTFTDEGIRTAQELRRTSPKVAILVLSQYVEERYATDLITSAAGALGYLLKDRVADIEDFLASLVQVAGGGTVLDPEVVSQLLTRRRRHDGLDRLTDRERDVLELMAQGRSNRAIAEELFISPGSVEKHISAVFTKLDIDPGPDSNRRVLAVLTHLNTNGPSS
ncbi:MULTISPECIES: response regulator transcription factor [unclassified Pseudactinotalea]|uniref:response regulator n=1 Tax=unclassified Pseudactinotalea TaxID=2649176 RepID=UPI00128C0786|nr:MULTISPECIES: response regulator transcription factor [unclassified Pseudactinotalea]MPV50164.1 response regulator [Pseudactinotalea sp. HY160]QGH70250.1 response regulator [Pseudactinotalea sp. HY158]